MRPTRSWCLTSDISSLTFSRVVSLAARCVLDHLENVREGRQREHRHDQPLDARRDDEAVGRMLQMMQEIAKEKRLALLLQSDIV